MLTDRHSIANNNARFTAKVLVPTVVVMLGCAIASAKKPPQPPPPPPPSSSPPTPSNFRVTATTAYTFTVAWDAATDSKTVSYDVTDSASPQEWVTLPRTATNFTFTKFLYPLHAYSAIIRAVDSAGNASAFVGTGNANLPADTTTPSTAPVVSVTDLGARHVRLAWTKPQDDDPSLLYKVFMNGSLLADVGTNVSISAVFLQPGTTYTFTVQGRDHGGNLAPVSSPVTVTTLSAPTDTTPPTTPGVFADSFGDAEVWLTWSQSTDDRSNQPNIRYDVFANGTYEGSVYGSGGPFVVYGNLNQSNTFEVIAVDEEQNQSSPGTAVKILP